MELKIYRCISPKTAEGASVFEGGVSSRLLYRSNLALRCDLPVRTTAALLAESSPLREGDESICRSKGREGVPTDLTTFDPDRPSQFPLKPLLGRPLKPQKVYPGRRRGDRRTPDDPGFISTSEGSPQRGAKTRPQRLSFRVCRS